MRCRLLYALTLLNLGGLAFTWGVLRPAVASEAPHVLRGRGLEIVDDEGRVRASIAVVPPVSKNGERQAETVLLRLITERGRPSVKLATSEDEASMSLAGPSGTKDTYIVLAARGTASSIRVRNESGREQVVAP